tara:strand:- start:3135 stop:3404 length:270 start_codon:yes stop_codon:yes gene_type:complete
MKIRLEQLKDELAKAEADAVVNAELAKAAKAKAVGIEVGWALGANTHANADAAWAAWVEAEADARDKEAVVERIKAEIEALEKEQDHEN